MKKYILVPLFLFFLGSKISFAQVACLSLSKNKLESCQMQVKQRWDQKDGQGTKERTRDVFIHVPHSSKKKKAFLCL